MARMTRHILKAAEVALDDPLRLSIDPPAETARTAPRSASAAPTVRITENHAEYAVIEVTCPCGRTTYVRCDYAAADSAPARQEPSQR